MNYLKRIGRLVAICICAVCVGIIPITAHGYFTSPVDGNYVIVNNGWGNNNVWIEPSTTYLDGTIHFTN